MTINDTQPKMYFTSPGSYGSLSDYGNEVISNNCEHIFRDAIKNVHICKNAPLREYALSFLSVLKFYVVNEIANHRLMSDRLPKLLSDISDDGCFFEWIFNHMRIGFNISMDDYDSGFFIISDDCYGELDISQPFRSTKSIIDILHLIEAYDGD